MPLLTDYNELYAEVYTDGSCHTQYCIGAWAAILFTGKEKQVLTGKASNTTHHRMELTAVIKAIEYVRKMHPSLTEIKIFSDSQYVIGLPARKEKLSALDFATKKGNEIKNTKLVKELLAHAASITLHFIKIKAHQKNHDRAVLYNREADKLSRNIVRQAVKEIIFPGSA
jgi:ribonuclease HI